MSGVALATVVVGAVSANQKAQASKRAAGNLKEANAAKLAFAQSQYDDYKEKYGDIDAAIIADVENFTMRDNLERYRTEGVVDVRSAFEGQKRMADRQKTRYGIDPSDPRYAQPQLELEQTKAEIGALSKARTQAEEERIQDEDKLFSRRLAVGQYGKQAAPGAAGVSQALSEQAASFGQEAQGYAKQAGAGYQMVGKGLAMGQKNWGGGTSDSGGYGLNETPDYGSGTMNDEYGTFSTGDTGW